MYDGCLGPSGADTFGADLDRINAPSYVSMSICIYILLANKCYLDTSLMDVRGLILFI